MSSSLAAVFADNDCVRFSMSGNFEIQAESDAALLEFMEQTANRMGTTSASDEPMQWALFGSLLSGSDGEYVVLGRIGKTLQRATNKVEMLLTVEKQDDPTPRPPRTIKPISRLLTSAPSAFGPLLFICTVEFAYAPEHGVGSAFPLPMSITLPGMKNITHIEGISLGKRTGKQLEHVISISKSEEDDDDLTHVVTFAQTCPLSRPSIGRVVRAARKISEGVLTHEGGNNGD